MRNPLSKTITTIQPSGIRKFFDIVSEMKDAISLGVGEPDFDTPWHIRDEGIYSLEKGKTFYTSNAGLKELKIEISNYLKRRCNIEYDYEKAVNVSTGYLPDIDVTLKTKKGICFDYAAMMTAMLRSQGIPTKLEIGYLTEDVYHSWISVYLEETGWVDNLIEFNGTDWELMDPTVASSSGSQEVEDMASDETNYIVRYVR